MVSNALRPTTSREMITHLAAASMADLILLVSLPLVVVVANAVLGQSVKDVRLVFMVLSIDPALEIRAHLPLDRRAVVVVVLRTQLKSTPCERRKGGERASDKQGGGSTRGLRERRRWGRCWATPTL
jgi:hypothetical protein